MFDARTDEREKKHGRRRRSPGAKLDYCHTDRLIGAIIGALVSRYGSIVTYPFRRRLGVEGKWFVYHYTFRGRQPVFYSTGLRMRRGVIRGTRVLMVERNATRTEKYAGTARKEGSDLLLDLKIRSESGSLTMRLRRAAVAPHDDQIFGIWLSYDYDYQPAAGQVMLSRTDLSEADAKDLMATAFDARVGVTRVRGS